MSVCVIGACDIARPPLDKAPAVDDPYLWQGDSLRPKARLEGQTGPNTPMVPGGLGVTVASLGSPAEPGLWLKTPLATSAAKGRVSYQGKTIDVQLIPIEGAEGAGSRISLQAMQALGIPLTELAEVSVLVL